MQNLFQAALANRAQASVQRPLLEFKAGKMTRDDSTGTVTADPRKGLVQVTVEESILHFKWKDRTTNTLEDDLMIFPEEATFKRIDKVKDGRVFVLEFTGGGREMFFWLQEPKTDRDEIIRTALNDYIRNPPQNAASAQQQQNFLNMFGGGGAGGRQQQQQAAVELDQLQRILQGLGAVPSSSSAATQQQQQQQTQQQAPSATTTNNAPSTTTTTTTTTATTTASTNNQQQQQQADALREALASLSSGSTAPRRRPSAGPSLSSILSSEGVCTALRKHPELVQQLIEHLPESEQQRTVVTMETVIDHVRSPQFRQSIDAFQRALHQSPEVVCYSIGVRPTTELLTKIYSGSGAEALANAVNEEENKQEKKDDQMETDE